MKEPCDCLNRCGDDERVQKGTAEPCELFINTEKRKQQEATLRDFLALLEANGYEIRHRS